MSPRSLLIASLRPVAAAAMLAGAAGAMAQGTPPNASVPNPATGAGQQSQQGTPMGTTGVPAAAPGSAAPSAASPAPAPAPMPASQPERPLRADRN